MSDQGAPWTKAAVANGITLIGVGGPAGVNARRCGR